jgi:alkylation response protein AidB-like acyl-CoA dehydrogenase
MKTTAVRDGDHWVLNGEKAWITNAKVARFFVALAKTDPAAGKRGISAFLVPGHAPGLSIGAEEDKLGLRASTTSAVLFQNCRIPAGNLLGELGQGFKIALATLDHSRLGIAAQSVGIHQRAFELARDYALERVQFDKPIAEHQAVRFALARMARPRRSLPRRRTAPAGTRSRSTAATASARSTRSRGSIATCASRRSTRGRARCSAW